MLRGYASAYFQTATAMKWKYHGNTKLSDYLGRQCDTCRTGLPSKTTPKPNGPRGNGTHLLWWSHQNHPHLWSRPKHVSFLAGKCICLNKQLYQRHTYNYLLPLSSFWSSEIYSSTNSFPSIHTNAWGAISLGGRGCNSQASNWRTKARLGISHKVMPYDWLSLFRTRLRLTGWWF